MVTKVLVQIAMLLCASLSFASTSSHWLDEAFPIKKHQFGSVAVGSKVEFRFPIHNPTKSNIHISSVRASCGCTTPIVETPVIRPGETGSILARYNTGTFRGKKGATLTVVIDRPHYTEVRLRVDGYIRRDIVFHPGEINFGQIQSGKESTQEVSISYAGRPSWKITDIRSHSPHIEASLIETNRRGQRINYKLRVQLKQDAPLGNASRATIGCYKRPSHAACPLACHCKYQKEH